MGAYSPCGPRLTGLAEVADNRTSAAEKIGISLVIEYNGLFRNLSTTGDCIGERDDVRLDR